MVVIICIAMPMSLASAQVYKWVDEAGNVHFGDRIPEQYERAGESVAVNPRKPSEAEKRQAEAWAESAREAADASRQRRLKERELSEAASEEPDGNAAVKKTPPPQVETQPGQLRLTRAQRMANYEAKMERYRESMRCFGKYQKLGGGTRGYAFEECESVRKPRHPDVQ